MALANNDLRPLRPLWPGFAYKPHQETGIRWMLDREDPSRLHLRGGLLCDEMGLGKTMEVLGVVLNSRKLETLLLCPKAVVAQWRTAAIRSHINVCEPSPTASGWMRPRPYTSSSRTTRSSLATRTWASEAGAALFLTRLTVSRTRQDSCTRASPLWSTGLSGR